MQSFAHFILCSIVVGAAAGCDSPRTPLRPEPIPPEILPTPDLVVTVDNAKRHQTMVGFGGDIGPWHLSSLGEADRERLLRAAIQEMGLNVARMNLYYFEGATAQNIWGRNDNSDPFSLDWSAFNFCTKPGEICNDDWGQLLPSMRQLGVTGDYLGLIQGPRWNGFESGSTFRAEEMVESQLAAFLHLRDDLGITIEWLAPFSEPGGGGINWPIGASQAVSVVKALGSRLEANGFAVRMIVPDAMTVRSSIDYARAILEDPAARKYVGAIGYHTYASRDGGEEPSPSWISLRQELHALAGSYGLPVRMTEYADIGTLMGRANHIYNELEHAQSQTYHPQHIVAIGDHLTSGDPARNSGAIVYYRTDSAGRLTGWGPTRFTGVAIGHYSRYAAPGSVRLGVESPDRGVRVQAFRDDDRRRLSVVAINNKPVAQRIEVALEGFSVGSGSVAGIQTREGGQETEHWSALTGVLIGGFSRVQFLVPARSITSVAIPL